MSDAIFFAAEKELKNRSVVQIHVTELGWHDVTAIDFLAGNRNLTRFKLVDNQFIVVLTRDLKAIRVPGGA